MVRLWWIKWNFKIWLKNGNSVVLKTKEFKIILFKLKNFIFDEFIINLMNNYCFHTWAQIFQNVYKNNYKIRNFGILCMHRKMLKRIESFVKAILFFKVQKHRFVFVFKILLPLANLSQVLYESYIKIFWDLKKDLKFKTCLRR